MEEYKYKDYIIKKVRRPIEGIVYELYKDNKLIVWDNRKKVVEETADWHSQKFNVEVWQP